jgi:hypothetical protein
MTLLKPHLRSIAILLWLAIGVSLVIWSPLLMYRLLGESMPWTKLADVGEAYGGASALLSAAALSGIGASLFLQSRQMRQEMVSLDRQRHFELVKLALENPEFFEVLDGAPLDARDGRRRIYANLTLTYWLAMWDLGEIDDAELRVLTSAMFMSPVSRAWWRQVHGYWLTARRSRRRQRFMRIVNEEWASADANSEAAGVTFTSNLELDHSESFSVTLRTERRLLPSAVWCLAGTAVATGLVVSRLRGRRATRNRERGENQDRHS